MHPNVGTKRDLSYFCNFQSFQLPFLDWFDNNNTPKLYSGALAHDDNKGTTNLRWHGTFGEFTFASNELSCCKFTITSWKSFHLTSCTAHFALSWNRLCVCCLSVKTIWPWKWDENTLDQVRNYLIHNSSLLVLCKF